MEKKLKKAMNNAYFKPISATFLVLLILCLTSIQPILALTFDNIKYFDKGIGKYGKVRIENMFGLGSTLEELELKTNTPKCSSGCQAKIDIELYTSGALVDDVRFLTRYGRDWVEEPINSYRFEVVDGEKEVDVYGWVGSGRLDKNGTEIKEYKKIGSRFEDNWIPYSEGEKYSPGNYTLRLIGSKHHAKIVDWQITSQGIYPTP